MGREDYPALPSAIFNSSHNLLQQQSVTLPQSRRLAYIEGTYALLPTTTAFDGQQQSGTASTRSFSTHPWSSNPHGDSPSGTATFPQLLFTTALDVRVYDVSIFHSSHYLLQRRPLRPPQSHQAGVYIRLLKHCCRQLWPLMCSSRPARHSTRSSRTHHLVFDPAR